MFRDWVRRIGARPRQAAIGCVDAAQLAPAHNLPFAIMTRMNAPLSTSTCSVTNARTRCLSGVRSDERIGTDERALPEVTLLRTVAPMPRKQYGCTTTLAATVTCDESQAWSPIRREIADMVARPHHDVVADLHVERDRLVVENEAVLADIEVFGPIEVRIDVADEGVTLFLGRNVLLRAKSVHPLITEQEKAFCIRPAETLLDVLERNDRQVVKGRLGHILAVDGKSANFVFTVAREKAIRDVRAAAGAEEDDLAHVDVSIVVADVLAAWLRTSRSSHSWTLTPALAAAWRASSLASGVTPSITPK